MDNGNSTAKENSLAPRRAAIRSEGQAGDRAATYTLQYASGKGQTLPVRHGIEGASRITHIATAAQPALEFAKDPAGEQYQILLLVDSDAA
jgi:hypothetical protein